MRIGGGIGNGQFTGQIDDVRIYSRALSGADIAALYAATGGGGGGNVVKGYFVEIDVPDANLGGLSGANATCLSALSGGSWTGKTAAQSYGQLTASNVQAWLCDSSSCLNMTPDSTYAYASIPPATGGGGGTFISTSQGYLADDGRSYGDLDAFNSPGFYEYFTGRDGTTNLAQANTCGDWASTAGTTDVAVNDTTYYPEKIGKYAKDCMDPSAIICMVHPRLVDPGPTPADCTGLGAAHYNDAASRHCYFKDAGDWYAGKTACKAAGGYLVTLEDAAEEAMLVANLYSGTTYIGGTDAAVDGEWRWTSGPLSGQQFSDGSGNSVGGLYEDWAAGEPNGGTGENCLQNWGGGEWNDSICTQGVDYACEIDPADCYSSRGAAGTLIYNRDSHVPQVCNGSQWIAIGPVPGPGDGAAPTVVTMDMAATGNDGLMTWNVPAGIYDIQIEAWGAGGGGGFGGTAASIAGNGGGGGGSGVVRTGTTGAPSATGLVGHWKFDDGTGSTTAADASGNSNTATLTSMTPASDWVTGIDAGALDFDGVDDWLSFSQTGMTQILNSGSQPFTISVWWKPTAFVNDTPIIARIGWHSGLISSTGGFRFNLYASNQTDFVTIDGDCTLNQWCHGVGAFDGTTMKLYVNGSLIGSQAWPYGNMYAANPIVIGGSGSWFGINGAVDDARIYNRVLSDQEVTNLYAGTGGIPLALVAAGGGGGGGGSGRISAATHYGGGGGGYVINSSVNVTPAETLNIYVGGGGASGCTGNANGAGGKYAGGAAADNTTAGSSTFGGGGGNSDNGSGGDSIYGGGGGETSAGNPGTSTYGGAGGDGQATAASRIGFGGNGMGGTVTNGADGSGATGGAGGNGGIGNGANGNTCGSSGGDGQVKVSYTVHPVIACTTPNGPEGMMIYNTSNSVLQYCDGQDWIAIGK